MKKIYESQMRRLGNNPLDFLMVNIIPNNLFVSIGYFKEGELSYGPKSQKVITKDNDEKLVNFLSGKELDDSPRFKKGLQTFRDSGKYADALAGKRNSAPMEFEGNTHIIKIGRTVVRWLQNDKFAGKFAEWGEEEQNIRSRHGFGKDEADYAENDWHRKPEHRGTSIYPKLKKSGSGGAYYNVPMGQSGLWSNEEHPDKVAIRQFLNTKLINKPEWYFIDDEGNPEKLNTAVLKFLKEEYSRAKVTKVLDEISEDEKAFVDELATLDEKRRQVAQYLLENVLYITGTSVDMHGNKEPFTWVNDVMIYNKYPWLKKDFIDSIIEKYVEFSEDEIKNISESYVE